VAKVFFARLCKEIKRNEQTGLYSLIGSFVHLTLIKGPIGFVCVVYWEAANETFRQSFALMDEAGNLLDETPAMECVLKHQQANISTAFFYTGFPQAGRYNINVFQNGICIETIPLHVMDVQQTIDRPLAFSAPLGSVAQS